MNANGVAGRAGAPGACWKWEPDRALSAPRATGGAPGSVMDRPQAAAAHRDRVSVDGHALGRRQERHHEGDLAGVDDAADADSRAELLLGPGIRALGARGAG